MALGATEPTGHTLKGQAGIHSLEAKMRGSSKKVIFTEEVIFLFLTHSHQRKSPPRLYRLCPAT